MAILPPSSHLFKSSGHGGEVVVEEAVGVRLYAGAPRLAPWGPPPAAVIGAQGQQRECLGDGLPRGLVITGSLLASMCYPRRGSRSESGWRWPRRDWDSEQGEVWAAVAAQDEDGGGVSSRGRGEDQALLATFSRRPVFGPLSTLHQPTTAISSSSTHVHTDPAGIELPFGVICQIRSPPPCSPLPFAELRPHRYPLGHHTDTPGHRPMGRRAALLRACGRGGRRARLSFHVPLNNKVTEGRREWHGRTQERNSVV